MEVCPVGTVGAQLPIITAEFRGTAQLIDFTGIYPGMPLQVFKSDLKKTAIKVVTLFFVALYVVYKLERNR